MLLAALLVSGNPFVCPLDIPPVPTQIHENWGTVLSDPGEFCGFDAWGTPMKCVCTAAEHEQYTPEYGDEIIPVIPYLDKLSET